MPDGDIELSHISSAVLGSCFSIKRTLHLASGNFVARLFGVVTENLYGAAHGIAFIFWLESSCAVHI